MQSIKDYLRSVRFALSYAFRFVPKETYGILVLLILAGILPYGSSFLLGKLVNTIITGAQNHDYAGIWVTLMLYASVSALPTILGNLRSYLNRRSWLTLARDLEIDILSKREKIDIAKFEDPKFLDLLQRTFRSGYQPIYGLISGQYDTVIAITSLIVGTILSVHFNPIVYLVVIASSIPSFIADIKYGGKSWSIWQKDSPEQRRAINLRYHINFKTYLIETKLLQASKKILGWLHKILNDFAVKQLNVEKSRLWQNSAADLIALAGFATGLFLIVRDVISGEIQAGSFVYMMGTLSAVRNSIGNLLQSVSGQYENHLIVKDIIEFANTQPVVVETKFPKRVNLNNPPEIVFENVGFKYQSSENWSLRNISLTLKAGDKIGLVGNNGAGKTTFVKLLCRIYDPTEGRILINGIDLKDLSTAEWWSYIAVMFQDYATYDFLVKEAIAISRPDESVDIERVKTASEVSQAHTFIEEWENKYDEQLGVEFKGKEPSKGQKQKLSIAKIIYRNAFLMILDEPTASVDAESEAKIFDSLESLSRNTTAILISHDFSTISQCDKIFVLDKGSLIEEGTHTKLMRLKGLYSNLYNIQAKRFKKTRQE
jgi:ATP-binding cassette subfamily B protein